MSHYDDAKKIDMEIDSLIRDSNNYKKFTQAVCAFITFESDDCRYEALEFSRCVTDKKLKPGAEHCQETIFNHIP